MKLGDQVMRTGSSDFLSLGRRGRTGQLAQPKRHRKSRDYRIDLEGLESRTLLATTPAVTATGDPVALSPFGSQVPFAGQQFNLPYQFGTSSGNANSPAVAIDPYDSSKLFAVWGLDLSTLTPPPTIVTAIVEAAYSSDGGTTWTGLGQISDNITDAATIDATPPTPYAQVTQPSVDFDASGNVYVLTLQSTGAADGALVLSKFNFSGNTPNEIYDSNVVYRWLSTSDAANTPTLDVDAGLLNPPAGIPADPHSNNVYVAWASTDIKPAGLPANADYNPNRAELVVSSDGGNSFSGETILSTGGNFGGAANGLQDFSHPALAINQNDDGQITAAWEDFGSGATATPNYNTFSLLDSAIVQAGDSFSFTNNGGTIGSDTTTAFPVNVNIAGSAPINNLTVTVNLIHPTVANLGLVLQAPNNGPSITLMSVGTLTGANIGVFGESTTNPGINIGTVFDDNATRGIFDPNAGGTNAVAAPAVGHYRPDGGETLESFIKSVQNAGDLNGQWSLLVEDTMTETTLGSLRNFTLQFTTGMTAGTRMSVASFFGAGGQVVGGALLNTGYPTVAPSTAQGIGPGLVLAEDNTLGPDSPFQGTVYAAFVGYFNVKVSGVQNPDSNTDIFLTSLAPGATRWSNPVEVNDDVAQDDGFSESSENPPRNGGDEVTGRSQYGPEIAVDQATGTVVLDWRDARDDAANARVATYITTSIDGGLTFSPQTYANPPDTAINSITGQTEVLGPLPDNQSGGNPQTDPPFGYGNQMGLAVFNGQVYPIWAGDFNQGVYNAATNSIEGFALNIWYAPMVVTAGPRITSSSMGPITLAEAVSQSVSISVTFDRPVDAATFLIGDVQVFFEGTAAGSSLVPLNVTGVTPVSGTGNSTAGYTQFTITFDPTPNGATPATYNYTGTYSYLIAPDNGAGTFIAAPIESFTGPLVSGVATLRDGDPMDQNADGSVDENPLTHPFTGLTPGDVYAAPMPQPVTPVTFSSATTILSPPFDQNTLPLIVPGPQVLSTSVSALTGTVTDNLITNGTTDSLTLNFDRPMQTSTFTPADVLQIMGPTGSVSDAQNFPSNNMGETIPAANSISPGTFTSLLTIPSYDGTFKIAGITVDLNVAMSDVAGLSAVLISPSGTEIPLFSGLSGANMINTVLDDSAESSITAGSAPFTGTFMPTGTLSTLTLNGGQTVDMQNAAGTWIPGVWQLKLTNTTTGTSGILENWSLNITPAITVSANNPSTVTINGKKVQVATSFTVGFPQQQLSGTYTVQIAPSILDVFGDAVDSNQNAGLDVLRDQAQNGPTTTVLYSSADLPKPIPTSGTVASTITVPDKFVVQGDTTSSGISGLRVQINMSYPNDPDLSATLYYDMGQAGQVAVPLFSGVGNGINTANFTNTIFDDNAATPIQNGSATLFWHLQPADATVRVRWS